MPEYIDKEKLIASVVNDVSGATETTHDFLTGSAYRQNEIIDIIKEQPAADVAEVKHAAWKWDKVCGQEGIYCTNCQAGWVNSDNAEWIAHEHDYCPKCGAKMYLKEGAEE